MERSNLAAAAGFGSEPGKQGIFGTFSAFLEMCVSEITMARLNKCNLLCHFSHAGVDDMADNTCHFGLNNFFADNGLEDEDPPTRLYFPATGGQMMACVKKIFHAPGAALCLLHPLKSADAARRKRRGDPRRGICLSTRQGRNHPRCVTRWRLCRQLW